VHILQPAVDGEAVAGLGLEVQVEAELANPPGTLGIIVGDADFRLEFEMFDQLGRGDPVAEIELDAAPRGDHLPLIAASGGKSPVDEIADSDHRDGARFSQAERPLFGRQPRLQLQGIALVAGERRRGRGGDHTGGIIAEAPVAVQLLIGGMAEAQRNRACPFAQSDLVADGARIHLEIEAEKKGAARIESSLAALRRRREQQRTQGFKAPDIRGIQSGAAEGFGPRRDGHLEAGRDRQGV